MLTNINLHDAFKTAANYWWMCKQSKELGYLGDVEYWKQRENGATIVLEKLINGSIIFYEGDEVNEVCARIHYYDSEDSDLLIIEL